MWIFQLVKISWLLLLIVILAPECAITTRGKFMKRNEANTYILYVGTYSVRGSKGIYGYRFDPDSGSLTSLGAQAELINSSFLALSPNHNFLYAVSETSDYQGKQSGSLRAYRVDSTTGKLTFLNEVASLGAGPCYVSVDNTGRFVLITNFHGGSIAVFPILQDGKLGKASTFLQYSGSSQDPDRQRAPHPHAIHVTPDNRSVLVADLGLDKLFFYRLDVKDGLLAAAEAPFVELSRGSGPRHFVFHPDAQRIYVLNEIKSTVSALLYDKTSRTPHVTQTISTLRSGYSGHNDASELQVDEFGRYLYLSNRGADDLGVYSIDASSGRLSPIQHISTGGRTPRYFAIDPTGKYVIAANEDSDNLVIFRKNESTGKLASTGQSVEVPSPVCLVFLPMHGR